MENFDFNEKPVAKEKNVFLLHLDIPRIILICAVIIGIVVTTFLLGMNFSENKVVSNTALVSPDIPNDTLAQLDKGIDLGTLPQNPDFSTLDNPPDNLTDNLTRIEEPKTSTENVTNKEANPGFSLANNDILSTQVINQKEMKKTTPVKTTSKKNTATIKNTVKKNKIVEVAQTEEIHSKNKAHRSWSIQVASYNTIFKAQKEAKYLHSMNYDAFVDKADISGKTYYRVKIGPILKEDKAIGMLQEIQSIDKYKESYIVKE